MSKSSASTGLTLSIVPSPDAGNSVRSSSTSLVALARALSGRRRVALKILLASVLLLVALLASLVAFHRGFRRTAQFWKGMGPVVAQYRLTRFWARRIDGLSEDDGEYKRRIRDLNIRYAPVIVNLIQSMGGIYVKIGQVISTVGQGLLPEEYTRALQPLQDGLRPRSLDEISAIIEETTGKKMDDIFSSFEERPIGAASIAQAHRATLRYSAGDKVRAEGEEVVIVKVQYPEVAEQFDADLGNLEVALHLFMPGNEELIRSLRYRHERELDFTLEAENLRECAENLQAHGVEPSLVRIPRVRNETGICNRNVLVMEYLEGTSLSDAIEREQDRMANAMGKEDAGELRSALSAKMREHFENGGGAGGGIDMLGDNPAKIKLVQAAVPMAAWALRFYAGMRERAVTVVVGVHNSGAKVVKTLSGGRLRPRLKSGPKSRQKNSDVAHVNLSRVLKTLIHVHGLQMLKDGVYNSDPHPVSIHVLADENTLLIPFRVIHFALRLTSSLNSHPWKLNSIKGKRSSDARRTARSARLRNGWPALHRRY